MEVKLVDNVAITILAGATGALISAFFGILTTYLNNKHSLKTTHLNNRHSLEVIKEKDRYEYLQYTNRMLYKYLVELERECGLVTSKDGSEVIRHAREVRDPIRSIYSLSVPFLDIKSREHLYDLYVVEHKNCFSAFENFWNDDNENIDLAIAQKWLDSLVLFRTELIESITKELLIIKGSRLL